MERSGRRPRARRVRIAAGAAVVLGVVLGGPQPAAAADRCSAYGPPTLPSSPRIQHHTVDGVAVNVLVPPGYDAGTDRYPVVYLLHPAVSNEDTWLSETRLLEYTAALRRHEQAIVVMPDGGSFGFYADWADGSHAWETFHTQRLVGWVDRSFRTRTDRRHRAVAGFSMGGFGSMHYAARHPGTYGAAAAFTGAVDLRAWGAGGAVAAAVGVSQAVCDGRVVDPARASPFGDPLDDRVYGEHNPVDLAPRYRGMLVYLSAANGVPCPGDERTTYSAAHLGEPVVAPMTERLHSALDEAGVPHVLRRFACGLHVMPNAQRGLEDFWPHLAQRWRAANPPRRARRAPRRRAPSYVRGRRRAAR